MLQLQRWRTPTLRELFAHAFARSHTRARPPVHPDDAWLTPRRAIARHRGALHRLFSSVPFTLHRFVMVHSKHDRTYMDHASCRPVPGELHPIHPNGRKLHISIFGVGQRNISEPNPTHPTLSLSPVHGSTWTSSHSPSPTHTFSPPQAACSRGKKR